MSTCDYKPKANMGTVNPRVTSRFKLNLQLDLKRKTVSVFIFMAP